jgi:hypothetical protein
MKKPHVPDYTPRTMGLNTMTDSEFFWNITLGENQGAAWNLDDAFIWPATGIGGQVFGRFIGDVPANERKIP